MQIVDKVVRVREKGTELVMIQTRAEAYMKIALYQTEPEMGVKIIEYLPRVLRDEKVRRELGVPDYDEIIIRPGRHPAREADITLIKNKKITVKLSVKFSPSGKIRYCVQSWKYERADTDLLALVPVRAIISKKSRYYIAIIYVPRILRIYPTSKLSELINKLLDEKRKAENLEMLWTINIREVASALRDYEMLRRQDEMLKRQDEMLRRQDEMLKRQDEMLRRQDEMLKLQRETLDVLKRILKILEESKKQNL